MPAYKRPTAAAIAHYAADYHDNGPSCGHHTSMSYGVMPTREDFDRAFDAVMANEDDGKLSFGNDPFVGDDRLTASETWEQLQSQLATWEEGEHADDCPGDGSCGGDGCPCEDAGSWCSSVLGLLGFEWC